MKKLTTEKCRDLINAFKFIDEKGNLSEIIGYALQALEIALPILEQQERGCPKCGGTGMADSGGTQPWGEQILIECDCKFEQQERGEGAWIAWGGGDCPVDSNSFVEVKLRSGSGYQGWAAKTFDWLHFGMPLDIIAYRIIPEHPTNQNGEQ